MKKLIALCLAALLIVACFAGCGAKKPAEKEFIILVKSSQSTYWQAAIQGVDSMAQELGVKVTTQGPNAESDIADQVTMLNNAIEAGVAGIGLAACDANSVLDSLKVAKEKGIPVICFDSGVPDAPEGSVLSTIATDNYGAGATAAEHIYDAVKGILGASVCRIGVVAQDATSESNTQRGLGFVDTIIDKATADGLSVAVVGNEYFVNGCKAAGDEASAQLIVEVAVPAQTTTELSATEASAILNKEDTVAIFGTNQVTAEGILLANDNLNVLGTEAGSSILAAGFDAGSTIKGAITNGVMFGAVTQSPLNMGKETVKALNTIVDGGSVSDISTAGLWYDASNIDAADIAPNLYD